MKKNKFLWLITGVFTMSLMSGCGSSGKIVVTIGMWPESQQLKDIAMFNIWKERFETDHPEYEIVGEPYTYSVETVHAKAQANKLPTVFQTWFTEPSMLVSNHYIKDVTADLKELGWYEKMDPEMRANLTFDDKVYGVPRDGYGLGLFLNLGLLRDYGILSDNNDDGKVDIYDEEGKPLYPTTFEDIYNVSSTIAELSEGQTQGMLILTSNKNGGWQFSNIAWNFGAELEKEVDGKWVGTLNDPKAVEALEWIQKMKAEDLLPPNTTISYSDWYTKITSQVAMAFVGSDVISLAVTNGGMNKDDIAFVPMPAGPYGDRYSLFGGTPYVFSSSSSDEATKGAIMFLEYMGRSPETSSASLKAMREGNNVAYEKGNPIIPTIKPWINDDYLEAASALEDEFVNVDMTYFHEFFDTVKTLRHSEVPYYAQEMYTLLDTAIQAIFVDPYTTSASAQLTTANSTFNKQYMSKLS
ncbi:MAG: extracellular solute-binding protein [Bacilli bacterium]|nr:extracellular solute-binding protein [Bacilli bacterium]MCH4201973.1 extracellular solute-binding protein [Bacilli bacterium]MCH4235691.1 extracellular solute-binding protein [Bacilli bacterium]